MVGINTYLRASDLARIAVGQVRSLKLGDSFDLREKKTGKVWPVVMNSDCVKALSGYLDAATLTTNRCSSHNAGGG